MNMDDIGYTGYAAVQSTLDTYDDDFEPLKIETSEDDYRRTGIPYYRIERYRAAGIIDNRIQPICPGRIFETREEAEIWIRSHPEMQRVSYNELILRTNGVPIRNRKVKIDEALQKR